jgi:hypothetical protein
MPTTMPTIVILAIPVRLSLFRMDVQAVVGSGSPSRRLGAGLRDLPATLPAQVGS